MGGLRSSGLKSVFATIFLFSLAACGGHPPAGASNQPAKVTLSPAPSSSLQIGSTTVFSASAQNSSSNNISVPFTFQSSNTDVLNIAPTGAACAGRWDATFTICIPNGTGVAEVTAIALGVSSAPTQVFVHPPIDNVTITVVPPSGSPPPACPGQQTIPEACNRSFTPVKGCLSTNQEITLQATAFSKGTDITALVGPFTWSQGNANAIKVTPITSSSGNTPTNHVKVTPATPGFAPIFATASGVSSRAYYAETCPVQCIAIDLGANGSQTGAQTSFATSKGTAQSISATAVDVQGCIVPKPSLTWSSSEPAGISVASTCSTGATCSAGTTQPSSAAITASCTPPACNIGAPQSVAGLNQPGQDPLIQPFPVYPVTAISGLVLGATSATSVLATSSDCTAVSGCVVNLYSVASTSSVGVNPGAVPTPPNSLLIDAAGDKAFVGSNFGAQTLAIASIGSASNPFSALGAVTGQVLAASSNGSVAIFSDTVHVPNQVYVVNSSGTSGTSVPLAISGAVAASFSPDGSKAFILGCKAGGAACNSDATLGPLTGNTLYIYSSLQSLQTVPLGFSANAVTFSSNGTFGMVSGGNFSTPSASATLVNLCDNSTNGFSLAALPAPPLFLRMIPSGNVPVNAIIPGLKPTGLDLFFGLDNTGIDIIATNTAQPAGASLCPQPVSVAQTLGNLPFNPIHVNVGAGTFKPIAFFVSPDSTVAYIVASDRSNVLVFNFNTNALSAIQLVNDPNSGQSVTPVSASMSVDGTLIYVAGTDGLLHQLNTSTGTDLIQINFPATDNPFCPKNSTQNCKLNTIAVRP